MGTNSLLNDHVRWNIKIAQKPFFLFLKFQFKNALFKKCSHLMIIFCLHTVCSNVNHISSSRSATITIKRISTLNGPKLRSPGYDIKPSDGEVPVLECWRIWSTPLLPLFPGPFWLRLVAANRLLSMGQTELYII